MANGGYTAFKTALMKGEIDLTTDAIYVVLVDADDYIFDVAHASLSDVPAGARIASAVLGNRTVVDGVFDADNVTLQNVTGDEAEVLILYKDTGVESTSTLIAYLDTGTGFPVTPNGSDIVVTWPDTAGKILSL